MAGKNLYALYENGEYIGDYAACQIEEITGYPRNYVSSTTAVGTRNYGKYKFSRTDDQILGKSDRALLEEFEKAAAKILRLAGGKND